MGLMQRNIKHRRSRRKLGPNQVSPVQSVAPIVTTTGTTNATITYARGVVVKAAPALSVATRTVVSYTQPSANVVMLVMSGNVTGLAYSLPSNDPNVTPDQGGQTGSTSGTFP